MFKDEAIIQATIENLDDLIKLIEEDIEGKYYQISELVEELRAELLELVDE